jgi:uncharacterized membrane protein YgaE (UPF0421/DUF939 family)
MSTEPPYLTLLRRVQAPRRTTPQSLGLALLFAFEAVLASAILYSLYNLFGNNGYWWAIVSAILVLQPGVEQSLTTALVRIAANTIGACAGLAVGHFFGVDFPAVLAAIIVVVFLCEIFRLDLGLRSACVSVIIVMTHEGRLAVSSGQRFVAVVSGCILALLLQLIVEYTLSRLGWLPRLPAAPPLVSAFLHS